MPKDSTKKSENIYQILKRRIIMLEYEPGEILNEQELAEEFDMSRTPIRAIFQRLNHDGILTIIPRIGAQVPPIDFREMKQTFELTREFDSLAAKFSIERMDDAHKQAMFEIIESLKALRIENDYQQAINLDQAFHDNIYASCGNEELRAILERLHYKTERLWHYSEKHFDSLDLFIDTLSEIAEAIVNKDKNEAVRASKSHIDQFVDKIKTELL